MFLTRAIGFGFALVVTYAVIRWTSPGLYWVEFALLVAAVVGVGWVVADASVHRPFLVAAGVSFTTVLCIGSLELITGPGWAQPEVLPPPATMILILVTLSLVAGATTGAVALSLRRRQARLRPGR
jgi:hypothetical protein